MELPDSVIEVCTAAARLFPGDAAKAKVHAINAVKALPEYKRLVDTLVNQAIETCVSDIRHRDNVARRRQNGFYGQAAKVTGVSPGVAEAYLNLFNYSVDGRRLGDIRGNELPELAASQERMARGHLFNATLLRRLTEHTPPEATVEQAVKYEQLEAMFREIGKDIDKE